MLQGADSNSLLWAARDVLVGSDEVATRSQSRETSGPWDDWLSQGLHYLTSSIYICGERDIDWWQTTVTDTYLSAAEKERQPLEEMTDQVMVQTSRISKTNWDRTGDCK